jgi:hypothetical protein
MLAIARERYRPWNVWCNLIEETQVFRFVPDSATRKNTRRFFAEDEPSRIAPIRNDDAPPVSVIVKRQRISHCGAWRDN